MVFFSLIKEVIEVGISDFMVDFFECNKIFILIELQFLIMFELIFFNNMIYIIVGVVVWFGKDDDLLLVVNLYIYLDLVVLMIKK